MASTAKKWEGRLESGNLVDSVDDSVPNSSGTHHGNSSPDRNDIRLYILW